MSQAPCRRPHPDPGSPPPPPPPKATRVMAENDDPERTLARVFAASFFPSLGMTEESLHPRIEAFYESEFPRLRSLTRQIPEAQALVRQAAQRGFELAVGTSPLFPRPAREQRLEWAGVFPREHGHGPIT